MNDQNKNFPDVIKSLIETGEAPWQKGRDSSFEMPFNPVTGEDLHPYNVIVLLSMTHDRDFKDPRWYRYEDALSAGGQVKAGERGVTIERWQTKTKVPVLNEDGQFTFDEKTGKLMFREVPLKEKQLVKFTVFNAEQIEGLKPHVPLERPPFDARLDTLSRMLQNKENISFEYKEKTHAFYNPAEHTVVFPTPAHSKEAIYTDLMKTFGQWASSARSLNLNYNQPSGTSGHALDETRLAIYGMLTAARYGIPYTPKVETEAAREMAAKTLLKDPSMLRELTNEAVRVFNKVRSFDPNIGVEQGRVQTIVKPKTIIAPVRPLKSVSPYEELIAAAKDIGVRIEENPVLDGTPQRVPLLTGEDKGVYQGKTEGGVLIATIQNEQTGVIKPFVQKGYLLGNEEKAQLMEDAKGMDLAKRKEEHERRVSRASECEAALKAAKKLSKGDTHPFLEKMNIGGEGLSVADGQLLIPAHDAKGKVWSYQSISETGRREFPFGTQTEGVMHLVGGKVSDLKAAPLIYLSESYEAAKTIQEATGKAVVVAFRAENLKAVGTSLKAVSPEAEIVIFGERSPSDPKRDAVQEKLTQEAANAIGAKVIHPMEGMSCFNETSRKFNKEIAARVISNIDISLVKALAEKPAREKAAPERQAAKKRTTAQER